MSSAPRQAPGAASAELLEQSRATQARTLEHLKAAITITDDTQRVGQATLEELAKQGETIERTQRKVDELDAQVDKASYLLKGMRNIFGSIGNAIKGKPKDPKAAAEQAASVRAARRAQEAQAAGRPAPDLASLTSGGRASSAAAGSLSAGSVVSLSASAPADMRAAQAAEDALLDVISANVDRIGQMGREMGAELGRQDKMLDELNGAVTKADFKLKTNAAVAKKMAS